MSDVVRADRANVEFFDGLTVEGYRMPSGEFRVGVTSASLILGYKKQWLSQVLSSRPRTMEQLQGRGFTGSQLAVSVSREQVSGASVAKTISLRDFTVLIAYAVSKDKKAAIALQLALTDMALTDFFRDAFGERPLTIAEKRQVFYERYAAAISPAQWREMDCQDIVALALAGDEEPFKWGLWNLWRDNDE